MAVHERQQPLQQHLGTLVSVGIGKQNMAGHPLQRCEQGLEARQTLVNKSFG